VIRWHLHTTTGLPFAGYQVTEAHYVRGRYTDQNTSPSPFEKALYASGVTRHDVEMRPGQEKGADVELALLMVERAMVAPLDVVVLISADSDFVPAVQRLTERGVRVIVPYIKEIWTEHGKDHILVTSHRLADAATESPALDHLLVAGMEDPNYPGVFPFVEVTATDTGVYGAVHAGRVDRWRDDESFGFIHDTHGRSWWLSKDSLLGSVADVQVGTLVSFRGSPHNSPGRDYPTAYSVRIGRHLEAPWQRVRVG
jgi:hypothetical protein